MAGTGIKKKKKIYIYIYIVEQINIFFLKKRLDNLVHLRLFGLFRSIWFTWSIWFTSD